MARRVIASLVGPVALSLWVLAGGAAAAHPSLSRSFPQRSSPTAATLPRALAGIESRSPAASPGVASDFRSARAAAGGVPDGSGGMYVFRSETHGGNWSAPPSPGSGQQTQEFFVLRITPDGALAAGWPAEGVAPTEGPRNYDYAPMLVPDDAGGVIVLWVDYLNQDAQITAQRLSDAGARVWGPGGIALTTTVSGRYLQDALPDGAGGAIVCWTDAPLGFGSSTQVADLRLQRVDSSGGIATGWPSGGLLLTSGSFAYETAHLVADGSGGAIAAWMDWPPQARAQRVTGAGVIAWTPAEGVAIASGSNRPVHVPDGTAGAIFVWAASQDILAQRYDATGAESWTAGGVVVCGGPDAQKDPVAAEDGSGGVVVGWGDHRGDPYVASLYAARLTSAGLLASGWTANGTFVSDSLGSGSLRRFMVADGAGGALLTWDRTRYVVEIIGPDTLRYYGSHFMVQHLSGDSAPAPGWPAAGVEAVEAGNNFTGNLLNPTPSPDGGLLLAWYGMGASGSSPGLYGQRLDASGARQWGASGIQLYQAPSGGHWSPLVFPGAAGGAHVAWAQAGGLYARVMDGSGAATGGPAQLSATPHPLGSPMVADGADGCYVAWMEAGLPQCHLHVQHLDATGAALWPGDGIAFAVGGFYPRFGGMVPDGADGVIVAWYDDTGNSLDAQRIAPDGTLLWGSGIVLLPSFDYGLFAQAALIPDGAGGAIAAGERRFFGPTTTRRNVILQRVDDLGSLLWGFEGVAVAPGDRDEVGPRLASDGAGGAIVCWGDPASPSADIWAQRVDAGGLVAAGWPGAGVQVCAASGGQILPDIVPDAAGGAIVAWWDLRGATPLAHAQRLDGSGAPQWTAGGIPLGAGAGAQFLQALTADGAGGAIAVWLDARDGVSWDLFAQRVNAGGTPLWGSSGLPLCIAAGLQDAVVLAADGTGGALAAWQDARAAPGETRVQKVTGAGVLSWTDDGVTDATASLVSATAEPGVARLVWSVGGTVTRATLHRSAPGEAWRGIATLEPDGSGRLSYEDREVAAGARYGYRLGLAGAAGESLAGETWLEIPRAAALALMGLRPNPAAGEVDVAFSLASGSPARLELLDLAGRSLAAREVGGLGPGAHVVRLDPRHGVRAGVYWLRLTQAGSTVVRKGMVLR
jgi:hypothetical protein